MPQSVSEFLKVDASAFGTTGALDAILDVDTRLFIDPLLLRHTKAAELRDSVFKIEERFRHILRLLRHSDEPGDVWERRAEALMLFPEVKGICIGYSAKGTAGSGMGPRLRRSLLSTAKKIIQVGVVEPDIFALAGLFEEDIGPDRISDMVAGIIEEDLVAFSKSVFEALSVMDPDSRMPQNPFNHQPIILVPRDILRDLPLALDWDDVDLVASHNAALRNEVNELIGNTWRKAARYASKKDVRDVMLRYPEILTDLIEQYRQKTPSTYDFDEDRAGQTIWHKAATEAAAHFPLALKLPLRPTLDDVLTVVGAICDKFSELIENHGLWKLLYDKNLRPKPEEAAQLLFFGIAHAYCEANDVGISPESDGGRGPVDFKFNVGYALSVVVELKLSRNKALKSGFTKQLPIYALSEKAKRGIYLVVDNGASEKTLKAFRNHVSSTPQANLSVRYVDGPPKASASHA